jgi:hypothetical protein
METKMITAEGRVVGEGGRRKARKEGKRSECT